jgi:hypothetical protein
MNQGIDYVFTCLHCQETFVVRGDEFNCRILRHGVHKDTLHPIPPHATKEECDALVRAGTIYGCTGPLQIVTSTTTTSGYDVVICDYI